MKEALRLFCFHHAGGGPSLYREWGRALAPHIAVVPVVLPGREHRAGEPRFVDIEALVTQLHRELDPTTPHAFFGHSMGALVAYRLACLRRDRGAEMPRALLLSGYCAPDLPSPLPPVDDLDDAALAQLLGQVGGLPPEVLAWESMLHDVLAVVRDDLKVCASQGAGDLPPLDIPIHTFGGDADPLVSELDLEGWRRATTAQFDVTILPGDHFYLDNAAPDLMARVRARVKVCGAGAD
jgi:surfactin synthase thioesterase subunit